MKERPIIFNDSMVKAILDGRKSATRRVAKVYETSPGFISPVGCHVPRKPKNHVPYCPYGQKGMTLWVREAHYIIGETGQYFYRADGSNNYGDKLKWPGPWKPSIHMPRRASRITLEITGVRVERVQEISPADCEAEGITGESHASPVRGQPYEEYFNGDGLVYPYPCEAFRALWDSINGKRPGRSWADNPWVWVIFFKRIGG